MIQYYWTEIEKYLKPFNLSFRELGFRVGATEVEISEVEKCCNITLPTDYKEFLKFCNGQTYPVKFSLIPDLRIFGTEDIINKWNYNKQFIREKDNSEFWDVYQANDKIRSVMFHASRIPIGENEGAVDLYLDYIPAPNGKRAQIIGNYTECDFVVLSDNIETFLKNYLILIQKGILTFTVEGEVVKLQNTTEKYFEINEIKDLFTNYCLTN